MPKIKRSRIDLKTDKTFKLFIAITTIVLITIMFPRYETIDADYTVGMVWGKEDLIAPFSFPIYKSEGEYEKEIEEARKKVPPVFDIVDYKNEAHTDWLDSLDSFFTKVKKIFDYDYEYEKEKSLPEERRTTSTQTLNNMKSSLSVNLTDDQWKIFFMINNPSNSAQMNLDTFKKKIIQSLNLVYSKRIIDIPKSRFGTSQISYLKYKVEENVDVNQVRDLDEIRKMLRSDYSDYFKNEELADIALKISMSFIYPDLKFDKGETEKILTAVTDSVPRTSGIVRENERIVSKHDPITESVKLKLDSYKRVRSEQMGSRDYFIQQLGRLLFVISMIALIGIFLIKMRPRIFNDNMRLILISTIILLECLLSYISFNLDTGFPIEYLIFVPVAAMLLTIIFDTRLAFYCIIIISVLVSAIRGGDYDIFIPNFSASLLVIYSVKDIKNRSQIFVSMFYILIGYYVTILAVGFERYDNFGVIRDQLYAASLNSLLSPILAYGLLIFYEKVFRVATDLVYLELSDFNHPLLRELSAKAPGTFHHSIIMGNLSEEAAKEIGASRLLARVGCYYHDIGKVVSPGYFVENQMDSTSKHEQLNPSLSAKMIIAHVKNGIKLAEKYRIPQEVIDFIPMHHGTTLVSYFYEKARSDESTSDNIHDYIYRYPGPKPQTKETGIVMLADAVEASTRAIEDPTPAKFENRIDEIIKARFMDGELDECELTLKDLIKIKQSFLKTIVSIHHHRIKYPEADDDEEK